MRKLKVTELRRLTKEAYSSSHQVPITVVLDNIRSMHNVGSIFRTADAFRLERIILCGITAQPPHPDIHKTALGAEDSVSWTYTPSCIAAIQTLKDEGTQIYALEQTQASISLEQVTLSTRSKYAIVVGNEVKGVDQEVIDLCDDCIEIPQFGTKHSLNVSVATGIALWQIAQPFLGDLDTPIPGL